MSAIRLKTSAMLALNGMAQGVEELSASFETKGGTVNFRLRWLRGQEWGVISEFWPNIGQGCKYDKRDGWREVLLLDDAGALPPLGVELTTDQIGQRVMMFNSNRAAREQAFAGRCIGCGS